MKIFITGGTGYLGAKILDYLSKQPGFEAYGSCMEPSEDKRLVVLDITDKEKTADVISRIAPQAIIHAAAVAHGADSHNEDLLEKVNVQGTQNVIDAAKKVGAHFVFVSSVSALQDMPYGISKLKGEEAARRSGLDYLILRSSVIIGSSPNSEVDITFNRIIQAIKTKKPLTEDCSWKFQPTWIEHVCEIILLWLQGKFQDKEPVYPIIPETKARCEISEDILSRFGVGSERVDDPRYKNDATLTTESLERNRLPVYHYNYVIDKIVEDIRQSLKSQ